MRMRFLLGGCILAFGIVAAVTTAAPSDVIDGPLIRPAASSSDPRDLSGVWLGGRYTCGRHDRLE
jgi:hypothetical protein